MNKPENKSLFSNVWNFEYQNPRLWHKRFILLTVTLGAFIYVVLEVLLGANPGVSDFTLFDFIKSLKEHNSLPLLVIFWLVASLICMLIRMLVIYISYQKSRTDWGESLFMQQFSTYFLAFALAMISSLLLQALLFSSVSLGSWFSGSESAGNPLENSIAAIEHFFNQHIPNLIAIESKWLALGITICVSTLPTYVIHRLSHTSRFCWLVFHRAHHCPMYLHPLAAPPAYVFSFLLSVPGAAITIAISRLIHTEALVMEVAIWSVLRYSLEIFNHADVLYKFAYSNPIVRNLSRLFGDSGVYHLVHHSALKEDQNINFSGGPFNMWDRIFGTYRKPYKKLPPLGLTHQPDIYLNPFRIIFSGMFQLAYEIKMNKDVWTRLKIIFAGVNYKPEHSRCYLKKF